MAVYPQLGNVTYHTCHCVQHEDKTVDVIVSGGIDSTSPWPWSLLPIPRCFDLGKVLYIF